MPPRHSAHHQPNSLYSHPEEHYNGQSFDDDDDDTALLSDIEQKGRWLASPSANSGTPPTSSNVRRPSNNAHHSTPSSHNAPRPTFTTSSSMFYSEFIKRYRSDTTSADPSATRGDPDNHYFRTGLGQLVDDGIGNEEDGGVSLSLLPGDGRGGSSDGLSTSITPTIPILQPSSKQDEDRLVWQLRLGSFLRGDVLKSEKSRIATVLEVEEDSTKTTRKIPKDIWLGFRARLHNRTEEEEWTWLEEKRIRFVDPVIDEILAFQVQIPASPDDPPAVPASPSADATSAIRQVSELLLRLDYVQTLYPNLKALAAEKPRMADPQVQLRCDALFTWLKVVTSVRGQIAVLQHWTGSQSLDVTQPYTSREQPLISGDRAHSSQDGSSFVERVLREESTLRMFEKDSLVTAHALIGSARDAQVNLGHVFAELNLPTFEHELSPLISFPTKLAQAGLRVRLDYIRKIDKPNQSLILDQMMEDLKVSIGLACTLKRQYESFLARDPDGRWNVPECLVDGYDETILESMKEFFKLLHAKLKGRGGSGNNGSTSGRTSGMYVKETDVLESQWATLNDVSMMVPGGAVFVAEQLCSLTNRLMVRVMNYFETQVRVPLESNRARPGRPKGVLERSAEIASMHMSDLEKARWYGQILENVRLRYRKLQRFARNLTQRFSNAAEYIMHKEVTPFNVFVSRLIVSGHILVHTGGVYEEDGTYIVVSPSLAEDRKMIGAILSEAFHVSIDHIRNVETDNDVQDHEALTGDVALTTEPEEQSRYILILHPGQDFFWHGPVIMDPGFFSEEHIPSLPGVQLDMKENHIRLVADGPLQRLALAKMDFLDAIRDEVGLTCIVQQRAHTSRVDRELKKIGRATMRLAESIVNSVHTVKSSMDMSSSAQCQELMGQWFLFAKEHGQHVQKHMNPDDAKRFNTLLVNLSLSWVGFICDDCNPNDRRTFRLAVAALEYTYERLEGNKTLLDMPETQMLNLQAKVANVITLLTSHFDILGARTQIENKQVKENEERRRIEEETRRRAQSQTSAELLETSDAIPAGLRDPRFGLIDAGTEKFWLRICQACEDVDNMRMEELGPAYRGRVLDNSKFEDRSLVSLASSSSTIAIRWQQGRFISAGAFGSVYQAINLDSGALMAVKEIKIDLSSSTIKLLSQLQDELRVMEMLHHPNIVEYYGIEVHRDKVYIFEEYCQGGSLATLLENGGAIEDEEIIQMYAMQILEGLAYLHDQGITHRDIKPDNLLLDHQGVIKFVDFGAAKILAKNTKTIQKSGRPENPPSAPSSDAIRPAPTEGGLGNSLTGTPMYMSPEIIKNDRGGRMGAMDIWSLGCIVLELTTGRKPWSNLDNEWAIMFHIGVATQHPPLPDPSQLSLQGIDFIRQCLNIDPVKRPSAAELMDHPWMMAFREALKMFEEQELARTPDEEIHGDETMWENASVARVLNEKEELEEKHADQSTPPYEPLTPRDLTV